MLLASALYVLAGGSGGAGGVEKAEAQVGLDRRPNVVVIQTDDQRLDTMGAMPKTRRLIGRQGTTFRNHFATHPRCCPSRASYLTGQYSHNHRVQANKAPHGGFNRLDHSRTLPVWLGDAGYVTGHIGKYMNGYQGRSVPPGWTEWYGTVGGSTTRMWGYKLNENGRVRRYGGGRSQYQTDVFARKASGFVRRRSGNGAPFFLSVNPTAPHTESRQSVGPDMPRNPRPAPRHLREFNRRGLPGGRSFNERDVSDKPRDIRQRPLIRGKKLRRIRIRWRSQLESLQAVDDLVAKVVGTLRRTGELRNTVVVFMSDNGYFLGEHRIPGKKAKLYEEGVEVPLLVRGPGFPAGASRRQLTGNVDIAPTILELANARSTGRPIDGISLLPLARSTRQAQGRDLLFDTGVSGVKAVRTSRYVYMKHRGGETELYDLRRDPGQLESQHRGRSYRHVRRGLAEYLSWLRRCSGDVCRAGIPDLDLAVRYRDRGRNRCVASAVRATVGGPEQRLVGRVRFSLNGKLVVVDTSAPFQVLIPERRLRRNGPSRLSALASLRDGRRLTLERRLPERCG